MRGNTIKRTVALILLAIGSSRLTAQLQDIGPIIIASLLPPATLANVSCRANVGPSTGVAIVGFTVTGQPGSAVDVLVRGVGPTLSQFGITGVLAHPVLTVFDSSGKQIATNTGWGTNLNRLPISDAFASTGAFSLPQNSADSALLLTLFTGNYTAVVSGPNNGTGLALIEVYSVPRQPPPSLPLPPPATTPGAGTG